MRSYLFAAIIAVFACNAVAQEQAPPPKKEGFWSKVKRITSEEVGNAVSVNGQSIAGQQATVKTPDGNDYKRISDTPLHDIFNSDAAINADYPHVAITITDYSDRIVERGMNPTSQVAGSDCLMFDATLWRNANRSETFDGLIYCAADGLKGFMKGAFNGSFLYGTTMNDNSGQRRTTGPLPPANVYPRGSDDNQLLNGPGYILMGNILMAMGFDFTYGGNTGRVWVVSTSNVPGT